MERNPRVALVLIRAEACRAKEAQAVLGAIRADTDNVVTILSQIFDIQGPWIIDSAEALQACQLELFEAELDLVVLAYQTQAGEEYLPGLLQAVGNRPLVVWCYLPWRRFPQEAKQHMLLRSSGPVGTFGALGVLRNLGASFFFTFGSPDDPRLIRDLHRAGRAARLRHVLRRARIGLLPGPDDQAQSAYVDEFRLMADFGPIVHHISLDRYHQAVRSVESERIAAYLDLVHERFHINQVSDKELAGTARATLSLVDLALDQQLDVLAVSNPSSPTSTLLDQRPGLYPDLLEPVDVLFQSAAELGTATANFILNWLTGSPTMLFEMLFWDEPKNLLVGGHIGLQNPALAQPGKVWVNPGVDLKCSDGLVGAQFELMARPGRVTLLQLRGTPQGWQATALTGFCLEGQPWVEAYTHAVIRLDPPVDHFLQQVAEVGAARHWIMAYGSVIEDIEAFCQMENVPLEIIQ